MLPTVLITFREVIEASLIVATILGILTKLGHTKSIKTVWLGTAAAAGLCVALLAAGSVAGLKIQELYTGRVEETIEGMFMMLSAAFITWAVFFLHTYFAHQKVKLLQTVRETAEADEQKGIFMLVFTAVFREGFEIVLFLSTIYLSANPMTIFSGFAAGAIAGVAVSFLLFAATIRLPVYQAFRATSALLILFAAGMLARGFGEFMEAGALRSLAGLPEVTFAFLPADSTYLAHIIKTILGLTRSMHTVQLTSYIIYVAAMGWWIFVRKPQASASHQK